jgi:hypothetical protein
MKHKDAHGLESIEALVHDRDMAVTLCNAAEVTIERLRKDTERLREVLQFVSTDPCFPLLGSVTHDEVRDALEEKI